MAFLLGHAWTWPVPTPVRLAFGVSLVAIVLTLAAATSRRDYARTRVASIGGAGLIALDTAVLIAALATAPALGWPMTVAVAASLTRIALTARALPRVLAR